MSHSFVSAQCLSRGCRVWINVKAIELIEDCPTTLPSGQRATAVVHLGHGQQVVVDEEGYKEVLMGIMGAGNA